MNPRRDWSDARQKIEKEAVCRRCLRPEGSGRKLEAAHIIGRRHDEPRVEGSTAKVLYVHPDSVIPLCRDCHTAYDAHRIGILPFLTREEQARAVLDAGSIESARRRLDPQDYNPVIQAARRAVDYRRGPEISE